MLTGKVVLSVKDVPLGPSVTVASFSAEEVFSRSGRGRAKDR